jgi:glycerophosphoryl diester phosphodiesterase
MSRLALYFGLIVPLLAGGCERTGKPIGKDNVVGKPVTRQATTEIIAHRGASGEAPENTLAAIQLAWRQNADAVEIDVYLSKDGKIVTIHDGDTRRVAGVDKRVVDQTLAELKALDVGAWRGSQWAGQKIPTLSETLATIPDGKRMFVEIKCGPEIIPELRRAIGESRKKPEQIAFISFALDVCAALKKAFPAHPVYYLSGFTQDRDTQAWSPSADELTASARKAGLDGLDLAYTGPINRDYVQKFHSAGLEVYVWTVNDLAEARRMAAAGVAGITTDIPRGVRTALTDKK